MADLVAANQDAIDPQQQIARYRAALGRIGFNEEAQIALRTPYPLVWNMSNY